ncbi:MASE1 domain-containing protein [Streptomyces sp. NPDC002004]
MADVAHTWDVRRLSVTGVEILAVAACYVAAGRLGLLEQLVVGGARVTPLWPPTGIAVSALLFLGLRIWPGIALGSFLVVMSLGPLDWTVVGVTVGNTLAPVCAWLMLRRVGFRIELDRFKDGVALVFLGALGTMLISATIGAITLVLYGKFGWGSFWPVWAAWWVGDAMGVLIVTPALLALRRLRRPTDLSRWPEALVLAVSVCVVAPLVTHSGISLLFLIYPVIIWAALRFQLVGGALSCLLVSVLATKAAVDGIGPFAHHPQIEVLINLQAFNGSVALSALLLSALVTEQRNTRRKIEEICLELVEVVDHLAPGETAQNWPLPDLGRRQGRGQEQAEENEAD